MSPFGGIGRGMKVGKEELCGLLAAVERYLKVDHEAEYRELEARVASIRAALKGIPGVETDRHVPVIANEVPHVTVQWDESARGLTSQQVTRETARGRSADPRAAAGQRTTADLRLDDARRRTQDRRPAIGRDFFGVGGRKPRHGRGWGCDDGPARPTDRLVRTGLTGV